MLILFCLSPFMNMHTPLALNFSNFTVLEGISSGNIPFSPYLFQVLNPTFSHSLPGLCLLAQHPPRGKLHFGVIPLQFWIFACYKNKFSCHLHYFCCEFSSYLSLLKITGNKLTMVMWSVSSSTDSFFVCFTLMLLWKYLQVIYRSECFVFNQVGLTQRPMEKNSANADF